MPKMKTKSSCKKRFKVTAKGRVVAAQAGKRVCLVEINGMGTIAEKYGLKRQYAAQTLHENVDLMSMTALDTMDDFGRRKLRVGALVRLIFQNRIMHAFIDGMPGLSDLLQMGKIENMLMEALPSDRQYDLAVLDAPATGHGLTLLAAARSMAEITRVGPFFDLANIIERMRLTMSSD